MPRNKSTNNCRVFYCEDPVYSNGLCMRHYRSSQRYMGIRLTRDAQYLIQYLDRVKQAFNQGAEKAGELKALIDNITEDINE